MTTAATDAEQLEAVCRERMAALVKDRGWDSRRARADELDFIDALLDEYNEQVSEVCACRSTSCPNH